MTVSEPVALQVVDALSGLVRTARSYAHVRHEQLGATGVTLGVLKRLAQGPARAGDLACALGVSPSAVSRSVATALHLGYVHRTTDPADARAHLLALTAAGLDELDRQHREHARLLGVVLSGWDDTRASTVLAGIAELDEALAHTVAQMRSGGLPPAFAHPHPLPPSAHTPAHTSSATADSVADGHRTPTNQDEKAYA